VLRVVRQLARDSGMTMLIVTDEMSFARDVSDRVVFMEHGRVAEQGPPAVIFRDPRNDRTRAFLQAILER
jgi:ABC-type histidine transport system ATPase subunit